MAIQQKSPVLDAHHQVLRLDPDGVRLLQFDECAIATDDSAWWQEREAQAHTEEDDDDEGDVCRCCDGGETALVEVDDHCDETTDL